MGKFKIGDKVRRIQYPHGNFKVGDIGEVIEIRNVGGGQENAVLSGDWNGYSHDVRSLELVKSKEYRVVKPFSIIDIYEKLPKNCSEASGEFLELLKWHKRRGVSIVWGKICSVLESPVLSRNLPWLCEKGFLEEVREHVLKIGDELISSNRSNIYKVIETKDDELSVLVNGTHLIMCYSGGLFFKKGSKLSEITGLENFKIKE